MSSALADRCNVRASAQGVGVLGRHPHTATPRRPISGRSGVWKPELTPTAWRRVIAWPKSRETCIWERPTRAAISCWVRSCWKRSSRMVRSRSSSTERSRSSTTASSTCSRRSSNEPSVSAFVRSPSSSRPLGPSIETPKCASAAMRASRTSLGADADALGDLRDRRQATEFAFELVGGALHSQEPLDQRVARREIAALAIALKQTPVLLEATTPYISGRGHLDNHRRRMREQTSAVRRRARVARATRRRSRES